MALRDLFLIFLTVFIWGTNFVAIRWGLDEMPPFFYTAARFGLVALPFVFFMPRPKLQAWKVVGIGFFIAVGQFGLLYLAIALGMRAGLASLIIQVQVIFTIILSFFVFNERITKFEIIGIITAFAGFSIFLWLRSTQGIPLLPFFLVVLAAVSWACGNLIYKVAGDANRLHITVWSSLVPMLFLFVVSIVLEGSNAYKVMFTLSLKGWLSLIYGAYFSTLFAYTIWAVLLGKYKAAKVTPFALLVPVFGLLSAWILLGETLTGAEIIASLLIAGGIYIIIDSKRLVRFMKRNKDAQL